MLAYRDGNAGAFETLYTRHRGRLYRFVLRSVKASGTAEELFQEVWIRVIEARDRYTPQARFTTWLYTIAHNLLVDHWRRKGLTLVESDEEPVSSDNPASQAEAREGLARFLQALESLPPAQREAFLLHEESFGKIVIHGHTPVLEPDIRPNRINIDTGAYATGKLTCLVLEGEGMTFI